MTNCTWLSSVPVQRATQSSLDWAVTHLPIAVLFPWRIYMFPMLSEKNPISRVDLPQQKYDGKLCLFSIDIKPYKHRDFCFWQTFFFKLLFHSHQKIFLVSHQLKSANRPKSFISFLYIIMENQLSSILIKRINFGAKNRPEMLSFLFQYICIYCPISVYQLVFKFPWDSQTTTYDLAQNLLMD